MATYKENHGTNIETVTSDPSNPLNGQVWYNSTDQALKGFTSNPAGTFSSGGSMNTSRYYHAGFGESNNAAFAVSGQTSPGGPNTNTETYNGSAWTEVADINSPVRFHGSSGSSNTSALKFGGSTPNPSVDSATTETWNGSSWTEVNDLNNARSFVSGGAIGTQTAGLCGPGYSYSAGASALNTEIWNGSTWTESGDSSTGGTGRFGLYDNAVKVTGTTCETWNGSTWSSGTNANNNITSRSGGGTASSGMVFGGEPPADGNSLTTSEEYISPTTSTVTFTVS